MRYLFAKTNYDEFKNFNECLNKLEECVEDAYVMLNDYNEKLKELKRDIRNGKINWSDDALKEQIDYYKDYMENDIIKLIQRRFNIDNLRESLEKDMYKNMEEVLTLKNE